MTPAESRQKLADLRQRASAAGLDDALEEVDVALAIAAQRCIGLLEEALATTPAPVPENPPLSNAPAIASPQTSMVRPLPSPQAVGQPGTAPRASVLAGLKKPRPARQFQLTFRQPSMPRVPPKPTWLLPDDLDIPF